MGLSIIFAIMESYDGTITVESEVGKGAAFHLYFPITEELAVEELVDEGEDPKGAERILFVDDEEMYAEMGEDMISSLGYAVTMKTNSQNALDTFKAEPDSFDLVITDQIMPDLSGDELMQEIRTVRPSIPIILCTGHSTQIDKEKVEKTRPV